MKRPSVGAFFYAKYYTSKCLIAAKQKPSSCFSGSFASHT